MQYLLTEQEYNHLQQEPKVVAHKAERKMDDLIELYLNETNQGCTHRKDHRYYCDGCKVRHYCTKSKEYTK